MVPAPHQLQPRLDSTHWRIQELTSCVRKYVDDPILNGLGIRASCEDEAGSSIRYSFERLIRSLSKSSLTRTTSSGPVELDIYGLCLAEAATLPEKNAVNYSNGP